MLALPQRLRRTLANVKATIPPAMWAMLMVLTALVGAIWWLALDGSQSEQERAVAQVLAKNENLVQSHQERASRAFQVMDQVLLALRDAYVRHGVPRALSDRLVAMQVDRNDVVAVSLHGPTGDLIVTTATGASAGFAERDDFKRHAADRSDFLLIGKPMVDKLTGQWIIPLTRRLFNADGSFGGVILMALDPAFLARSYQKSEQGANDSMALIGLDGITRARRNGDKLSLGDDASASQLFKELPKAPHGTYTAVAASDGQRRMASYRALPDFPMVAVVATSLQELLSQSRQKTLGYQAAAGLCSGLLFAVAGLMILAQVRRQRAVAILEGSERRYRLLFENSSDAVLSTQAQGAVLTANPAACAMFGWPAPQLCQRQRSDLFDPGDPRLHSLLAREAAEGKAQGEVRMVRGEQQHFEAEVSITLFDAQSQVSSLIVRDVTQRRAAEEHIKSLAFYDPLTKLPNRRLLMDRLGRAQITSARHRTKAALVFVDLDHFKLVNDTLGHAQGDVLLQRVAQRLLACVREGDTCARLGGDEFVVMLEDLSPREPEATAQAQAVSQKISQALHQPYPLAKGARACTASLGVTLFGGDLHEASEEPLQRADHAMYQAKLAGRDTVRFFDRSEQQAAHARLVKESELRAAVQAQQWVLHYQPQYHGPHDLVGMEALVRWQHPQLGLVMPGEFIGLAEQTGLIVELGQWVLDTACAQLAQWAQQPRLSQLRLSVNVSPRQFQQPEFVAQVKASLQRAGLPGQRLKLELTEGFLVSDFESAAAKMDQLKAVGIEFSLDDFGMGYSALSYLKRLPLAELKIDRAFIADLLTDPHDAAITHTVIALADSLGLKVMAEGVETQAQRDYLAHHGCHAYQGYFYSQPLSAADFERFVASHAPLPSGA